MMVFVIYKPKAVLRIFEPVCNKIGNNLHSAASLLDFNITIIYEHHFEKVGYTILKVSLETSNIGPKITYH